MKTMEQWYAEWDELEATLPGGFLLSGEQIARGREMLARARAIHAWMHGFGPEPPETWAPTKPATPDETEHWRKWNEAHPWGESSLEIKIVKDGNGD
ncbi:MAG: hypothetical protein IJ783_06065 [Kiritimatiellae bacterium]|nr:hypothetical protein [Kiritimatiellia bacterium]